MTKKERIINWIRRRIAAGSIRQYWLLAVVCWLAALMSAFANFLLVTVCFTIAALFWLTCTRYAKNQ